MRLHAVGAGDDQHRAVQHLQRPLHFRGKVRVAGGVQQDHGAPRQFKARLLGEDRNPPLALQAVGVKKAVPMIHTPQLFQFSGTKQHGLGQGGLPRVHMGQHADHSLLFVAHTRYCNRARRNNQLEFPYLWALRRNLVILMQNIVRKFETLTIFFVSAVL